MDERSSHSNSKMNGFSTTDQRADFWKVRIVPQNANQAKIYLFPSLLEWLKERPQFVLNSALVKKESQLGIELPDELADAVQRECTNQSINGDPLTLYIGGYTNDRPSTQDIVKHLQRSYLEMYERNEHCRSRELVSLIDASLLLDVASFASKLCEENNYEHDLLQLYRKTNNHIWDDYKTSVMLRLSRGGAPSPEMLEAATMTRLMCDLMAGPAARRRSAVAEMAANGLKLDAMILAKLYFSDSEIYEQLFNECASFFEESVNSESNEIAEMVTVASKPLFERHLLRCTDQLNCYRILRIDFALNEKAPLEKKLVGRLELSKHVKYVIADCLAYRNFDAIALITGDAAYHLDKYSFFCELEQIVYPMAINMLTEAARMIFHAKPASVGWKKQRDESDKMGCVLQQHANGYIGGLIELWLKRSPLTEIARTHDTYRQRSLITSVQGIASVLRDDDLLNPICKGMLIFACDFVCSAMEALFGRKCQRIDELIRANPCLEYHTGVILVRRLTKGVLSSRTNEHLYRLLDQLCDLSIKDTTVNRDGTCDSRTDLFDTDSVAGKATSSSDLNADAEANQETVERSTVGNRCQGVTAAKLENKESPDDDSNHLSRKRFQDENVSSEHGAEHAVKTASGQSSDLNDSSSVAPSKSVCEQVATMMEGVKYCRERERGSNKNANQSRTTKATVEPRGQVKEEPALPKFASGIRATSEAVRGPPRIKHEDVEHCGDICRHKSLKAEDVRREPEISGSQIPREPPISSEGTECAQIISDDHLDFSSTAQDPSIKTKWLPGDATSASDKTCDAFISIKKEDAELADASEGTAQVAPEARNDFTEEYSEQVELSAKKTTTPGRYSNSGVEALVEKSLGEDGEAVADLPLDSPKKEARLLQPPLSPGLGEGGRKSPLHKQVVGRGKAMIQKLLTENNHANSLSRLGSERIHEAYTERADVIEKTHSFADFIDGKIEQSNPFRATRESVFCTSSQESVVDSVDAFDDDIAAAFSHPSDAVPRVKKIEEVTVDEATSEQYVPKSEMIPSPFADKKPAEAFTTATPTNTPSSPLLEDVVKQEPCSREEFSVQQIDEKLGGDEPSGFSNNVDEYVTTKETFSSIKDGDTYDADRDEYLTKTQREQSASGKSKSAKDSLCNSGMEFAKESGDFVDSNFTKAPLTLEAIQEKSEEFGGVDAKSVKDWSHASELPQQKHQETVCKNEGPAEENFGVVKERTSPKKFMSGGFSAGVTSGFGSFGSSCAEKENAAAFSSTDFYSADKGGGGFDGERGGGFGRGGGRGRGFDRDGQRSRDGRDNYRDRDGRDGYRDRDGFRHRGGYGGGGRDSRSEGRCGFRGNRN